MNATTQLKNSNFWKWQFAEVISCSIPAMQLHYYQWLLPAPGQHKYSDYASGSIFHNNIS